MVATGQKSTGWHTDNDFYRQFLDSGEIVLTVICLFSDVTAEGGATMCCEEGIKGGSGLPRCSVFPAPFCV